MAEIKKQRGNIGNISEKSKTEYKKMTGEELTITALRLLPYLLFQAIDQQPIRRERVTKEEKEILMLFTNKNLCICYPFFDAVAFKDKAFYSLLTNIIFEGYVLEE